MLNTRDSMREGTNERTNEQTYTMTKHITTLLLRSRVKNINLLVINHQKSIKEVISCGGGEVFQHRLNNVTHLKEQTNLHLCTASNEITTSNHKSMNILAPLSFQL